VEKRVGCVTISDNRFQLKIETAGMSPKDYFEGGNSKSLAFSFGFGFMMFYFLDFFTFITDCFELLILSKSYEAELELVTLL
jgi:hypothetical protein